jgi:hypothetical protein
MRFTIRDLLWLTVVVAFAVLWWGEYQQRLTDSADLRAEFKKLQLDRDRLALRERLRLDLSQPDRLQEMRDSLEQILSKHRDSESLNNR